MTENVNLNFPQVLTVSYRQGIWCSTTFFKYLKNLQFFGFVFNLRNRTFILAILDDNLLNIVYTSLHSQAEKNHMFNISLMIQDYYHEHLLMNCN